jgi:hypothetical protein
VAEISDLVPRRELAWAAVVRPGDLLVVGLAETDNVNAVAKGMQAVLEPMGVNVLVVDNVQQMLVARPKGGDA